MERAEIISTLREVLPQLQQEFGIYKIGLFGSYARQQHTAKSDIDLVYELEEGKTLGFRNKLEVEKRLKKRLGKKKIEFINYRYLNPVIRVELLKDVIYV
ncbi:nucleotidyltransferase family protein [Arsenicibacter rosenii]|uniref:Polymerase beta nucleotidyltransferase domain-containing protein n=1 Tax=Arsenicibacter rosenii TaxID=1750698 RepID=A0A1S2VMA5_9BACT|nr:nucleotidyltransferase domain-containing protein [Arsenicibacter rosenii]OIN59884.1 hypothetical protein BLX24_08525 [Arsenicibacter rosenii]